MMQYENIRTPSVHFCTLYRRDCPKMFGTIPLGTTNRSHILHSHMRSYLEIFWTDELYVRTQTTESV